MVMFGISLEILKNGFQIQLGKEFMISLERTLDNLRKDICIAAIGAVGVDDLAEVYVEKVMLKSPVS
jgi:hypothetical protein